MKIPGSTRHRLAYLGQVLMQLGTAMAMGIVTVTPSLGAEQLKLQYGFFSRTVPVSSLVTFAEEGIVERDLEPFLAQLDDDALDGLRTALTTPREEDPIAFSQKLYSPMGTRLLSAAGLTAQTGSGLNGQIALRAALSKAMAQPEGAALIDVVQYFPTETLTIDLVRAVAIKEQLDQTISYTNRFTAAVMAQSAIEAQEQPVDYAALPDLRDRGPYAVQFMPLDLVDETRDRPVPADLFLPDIPSADADTVPIIVFSHGLGHSRIYFRDVAEHVASYGFAVAMPEHIGSNETQRQALESWLADEFFQRREFVNRPQDVSFLLDELERLNGSQFQGRLDTDKVGAIGHSFGGYTVLVNAGATVDFDWLEAQCTPDAKFIANISRLLQCRALELSDSPQDMDLLSQGKLKDDRIQLVMAFNTVSNLFGANGATRIQIPTVIAGGVYDFITPIIPEQADTFQWLTTPEKYFLLVDQKAHGEGSTRFLSQFVYSIEADLSLELTQAWLRSNYKALLVAFGQTYVSDRDDYRPYLTASYVDYISQSPFAMSLIRELSEPITFDNHQH